MGLLLTTIFSAALWVVLIALDTKPFDALLLSILIILIAGTVHVYGRFLPGHRPKD